MNFETNITAVTNSPVSGTVEYLTQEVKRLTAEVNQLKTQQASVTLSLGESITSNLVYFKTKVDTDGITISYDFSNALTGTDYKFLGATVKVFAPDKFGNRSQLTEINSFNSNFTLKPINFPAKAFAEVRVSKGNNMYLVKGVVDLSNENNTEVSTKLTSIPSDKEQEMTIQEAINFLFNKIK